MTYYKLVSNGKILDAIIAEEANWIIQNGRNYSLFSGEEEFAWGVEASDGHATYHILGCPVFHDYPDYETVELVEIDREEYVDVMADIIAERAEEGEEIPGDDPDEPEAEAKTRLQILEETIAGLREENEMLVECILEMSEIVYGGDL